MLPGQMMNLPLTITSIMKFAEQVNGNSEIVSITADNPAHPREARGEGEAGYREGFVDLGDFKAEVQDPGCEVIRQKGLRVGGRHCTAST